MAPSATEVSEVLAEGREEMAGLFTDLLLITRPAAPGKGPLNQDTGQYDQPPARVVVYHGPGRMQVKADINSNVVETTAGDHEFTYLTGQVQLPTAAPLEDALYVQGDPNDVDVDNVINWLAAPESPSLEGTVFNVAGPYHKSQAVYLRYRVREAVA